MKKKIHSKFAFLLAISLSAVAVYSQEGDENVKQKITDDKGRPTLITFNENASYKNADAQQVFKDQLGLTENSQFVKQKSETDKLGFVHEKYQLFHKGVKVEFATYTLHTKAGKIKSMNGDMYALENCNTSPRLTKEQAFSKAIAQIGAKQYLWENSEEAATMEYQKPAGELVLLPVTEETSSKETTNLRLAYKYDIYATNPVSRGDLYIDAVSGKALFYNATIKHLGEFSNGPHSSTKTNTAVVAANADTRYSGAQTIQTTLSGASYILADATRGGGVNTYNMKKGTSYTAAVNFTDADNNWTAAEYANTNKDNGALDAHWGAEKTYDYWSTVHGRNSYNNAGAAIKSYVHYSSAYDNAYWDGSVMTYGDGSGTYFDILTSIDVAGHEIGHAVCSNTANLAYQKESGAMNEALSDIWGACIEYFSAPTKSTWLIGEDIERRAGHLSLRSMSNPKTELQPDTYAGTYWKTVSCTPTSTNDYCGVHTNSGVLNHWFYILTIGKTGTNDKGSAYSVTGIGIDKAAKITYRMESVYMTSSSTFANARTYGIQAATDLFGANSAEVIATTNAFYAVGVGAVYAGPSDTVAPTAPATLAASGTTTSSTILTWSSSSDNVAVTGYNVYNGAALVTTVTGLTYTVTGLAGTTAYTFTVKAKDAAGNLSTASNAVAVTTLTPVPDTTAPSTPTALTASGTTSTSTNLSWTAATDNVAVTGYNIYKGAILLGTTTGTTYAVSGLIASTAYSFYVQAKDAAGNVSTASNTIAVTTSAVTLAYCTSQGTSTADEKIGKVVFGTISNTSTGTAGYEDFTALSTNVVRGTANTITITPAWTTTVFKEGYAVWIDYNKNGVFTDTGELVFSKAASTTTPVSGTFTIPATATLGATRMRVSMKYNAIPASCGALAYGQVEDYSVNIAVTALTGLVAENGIDSEVIDITLYPNPVENRLYVGTSNTANLNASYSIINHLGQEVKQGKLNTEGIDVSDLRTGMYFIKVTANQKTISKKFIKK